MRNAYQNRMKYEQEHLPEPQIDFQQVITNLLRVATNPHNCPPAIKQATENLKLYTYDARVAAFFAESLRDETDAELLKKDL